MNWKKTIQEVQRLIDEANNNAKQVTRKLFPEGTEFDLGNQRYRVIAHESNKHRKFGIDVKNVKNRSTRPVDVHRQIDEIKNIERP